MRRRFAAIAWSLLLAVAVAACGGNGSASSNGVAAKSPDAIVSAVSSAVAGVRSVHVSGSVRTGGSSTTLNLNLLNGKGGRGSMSQNGLNFQIVAVDQEVYLNASPAFWRHVGGNAAAQLFSGKWLKAPAGGQFASLAALTNLQQLFTKLLSSHGKLAKGATTTISGQKVVAVTDTTKGGTLYVATTGKPYPIEIVKSGSQAGQVNFDHFNESVSLTAPANAIDISQLK
jgi:hypothetical protein